MQLILAIWRSAASTCWHNIRTLRSFVTVIKSFSTLIIQSLSINKINLYHLFLTKKKRKNQYRAFNYAGPVLILDSMIRYVARKKSIEMVVGASCRRAPFPTHLHLDLAMVDLFSSGSLSLLRGKTKTICRAWLPPVQTSENRRVAATQLGLVGRVPVMETHVPRLAEYEMLLPVLRAQPFSSRLAVRLFGVFPVLHPPFTGYTLVIYLCS
jgi:hypothetical protein